MNTTYFLNCVAGNLFRSKTNPPLPTALYIGLSLTAPSKDGQNVKEPAATGAYKRMQLTDLSAPTDGAATGGNLLMYGALEKQRIVESETIVTIRPKYLKLTVKDAV